MGRAESMHLQSGAKNTNLGLGVGNNPHVVIFVAKFASRMVVCRLSKIPRFDKKILVQNFALHVPLGLNFEFWVVKGILC